MGRRGRTNNRLLVFGEYKGERFILADEDGVVYRTIRPNSVFKIGRARRFIARPVEREGGQRMLLLVPLRRRPRQNGNPRPQKGKGFLLHPGLKGLWALTGSEARKGVCIRL